MTDARRVQIAVRVLAEYDPAALERLYQLALDLLCGDTEAAHRVELELQGRQVLYQALGGGR